MPKSFAIRVEDCLDAIGKTWPDLMRHLGISYAGMKKWRDGSTPSAAHLLVAADYLNVSPRYLLTGKGAKSPARVLADAETILLAHYRALSSADQGAVMRHASGLAHQLSRRHTDHDHWLATVRRLG